ncbi:glycosyl hydrolase family protein 17 [Arabidopsis lyrata subsp. lyrata]|uniref:Glycosyl hydrolase family protein 17 n=1 Tax=Arabidopsis lyrata subsp. lyrata TaxID=81972 RepID=D7LKG9_ARALL|nr:glycosyl hydrolase family protein 17 [Arabidopsis lyrata subsp. lyrata]
MAKAQICLCFIIILYLWSEGNLMKVAKADRSGDWCVAKPSTANERLQENINFACSKIDCQIILEGGACYLPDNLISRASVAMNLYYQAQGRHFWNCNFEGSGLIGITDPSYGSCIYQFRK